jgi:hypothetical protein
MHQNKSKSKNKKISRKSKKSLSRYNFNRSISRKINRKKSNTRKMKKSLKIPQKGGQAIKIAIDSDIFSPSFKEFVKSGYVDPPTSDKHYLDLNLMKKDIKNLSLKYQQKYQHLYDLVYQNKDNKELVEIFDHGIYKNDAILNSITAGLSGIHVYIMKPENNDSSIYPTIVGVFDRL